MNGNVGTEYARAHLVEVVVDQASWQVLYKCPSTGKYWKEYLPYPEAHGGGPPEFVQISVSEAKREFDIGEEHGAEQ